MDANNENMAPIGVFDSGYGGLTVLRDIKALLPQYDYLYLGDNARAPYGSRSFELVYDFTLQAVEYLFGQGCRLVIVACNTASAKALRSIQQNDLPRIDPNRRVLGVIRPTVEQVGEISRNGHIGILGTPGTIASESYNMEIAKLYPHFHAYGQPCPMWVPLVENKEYDSPGADYFVKKYLDEILGKDPQIDTLLLGCTHYPILLPKISRYVPDNIRILSQGEIVAKSLADYLRRHPEIETKCSKGGQVEYLTTESSETFDSLASVFIDREVRSARIAL